MAKNKMHTLKKENSRILKGLAKLDLKKKQQLLEQLGVDSEHESTLKKLHQLLCSEQASSVIQELSCWLIADIGSKRSTGALLQAFNDKDDNLSHMAMLALAVIKSDKALNFMIETLQRSPNNSKRRSAAYVLQSYFNNERAVDALIYALNDKAQSPETRAQAAEGLGTLTATRATNVLVANLRDPSLEVRAECVWALGQVGMDAAIIPELERFIGDKSKVGIRTIEEEAIEAIRFIKARAIALEKYNGDKSTADVWTIHTETLDLVEEMEKAEAMK